MPAEYHSNHTTPHTWRCIIKPTATNWKAIDLTGIVLRRPLGDIVIVPCEGPDGRCWLRFDQQLLKWNEPTVTELVTEVDAAWSNPAIKVEVLTHDLPVTETGQLDPFSL